MSSYFLSKLPKIALTLFLFLVIYTELYDIFGKLPTTEMLRAILKNGTEEALEVPTNSGDKKILEWYIDRWLPVVIGSEYWDEKFRHYQLQTDKIKLRNGKQVPLCSVESEAFGLLVWDNCKDKWENIFNLKKQNPGKLRIVSCKLQFESFANCQQLFVLPFPLCILPRCRGPSCRK